MNKESFLGMGDNNKVFKECLQNIFDVLPSNKKASQEERYQTLIKINKHLQNQKFNEVVQKNFCSVPIFLVYRELLLDANLHLEALKFFEIFLRSKEVSLIYKQLKIHILISRNLEKEKTQNSIQNIIKYLKFFKKWIQKAHENFPKFLGFQLIFLSQFKKNSGSLKSVRQTSIELLRLLAIRNITLFHLLNGFSVMVSSLLDKEVNENEEFVQKIQDTMIFLLESSNSRNLILQHDYLGRLFSVFCDLNCFEYNNDSFRRYEVSCFSSSFLSKLLKSSTGLFFLLDNMTYFDSLVDSLISQNSLQTNIFSLFDDFLDLSKDPESYIPVLQLKLLLKSNFFNVVLEMTMIPQYEERSKELMLKLMKLLYQFLPQASVPSTQFLIYSLEVREAQNPQNKSMVSKILSLYENLSKIVYDKQITHYFEMIPHDQLVRKNDFLHSLERVYLRLPVCYKDVRINQHQFHLKIPSEQMTKEKVNDLLISYPTSFEKWNA